MPAAIRETGASAPRIGPQAQREQIGKVKWCLNVQPAVRFEPDADGE